MKYYAHSKSDSPKEKWQTVKEHCEEVGKQVASFSSEWCDKDFAFDLGLLHDIGKYQQGFQERISGKNNSIEHAICGAKECKQLGLPYYFNYCLQSCIAGHHSGLPDVGTMADSEEMATLCARLKRETQDYSVYKTDLALQKIAKNPMINTDSPDSKSFSFWVRMMFSCLTDADYLDTERFCNGETERGVFANLTKCEELLRAKMDSFVADTDVKVARKSLQKQIMSNVTTDAEIYFMNMPTGSGKTLASMQFALARANRGGKKRIIYIIIEQNAKVFKDIFGETSVLEHHCNFDYDSLECPTTAEKLKRSAENWDASIIVTTNVQFFESIYSNKSSHLRKLHNIADSILIFDEAHMFPSKFYKPCLDAINIFVKQYNCEAIFLSATMPDFYTWLSEFGCVGAKCLDLIQDKSNFNAFSRCKIENLNSISLEKLLVLAQEGSSSLIVVNSKKNARRVYERLQGLKYHLSTYMTH
ncbi:MAG: CRISPR-associated endonuclease Cas3'', partial [Clostridia bacterium]